MAKVTELTVRAFGRRIGFDAPLSILRKSRATPEVALAVVMVSALGALVVPLPPWAVDIGIALNLAASLSLLSAALNAKDALQVASFPTALLLTTLARLAMSVSSTRLALSTGHAGDIIAAFGEFVVRGDFVVGTVVFAILTVVQFLVVTKGAERVAEVSARFTLDAMPGKQMSIDADLRAGAITLDEARDRRRALERESQLFGSMDGAMKFVKGDAIAGIVIVLANLAGGTAIGVARNGMAFAEAIQTYALLAIGDGLCAQLPSLTTAVAAGVVVTRVASDELEASIGRDIGRHFFGQARALGVVGAACVALAAVPGMPHVTFFCLAAACGGAAAVLHRRGRPDTTKAGSAPPAHVGAPSLSPLVLEVSADLSAMVQEDGASFVSRDLDEVRHRVYLELGVRLPGFHVRTNAPLPPRTCALLVDEIPAGSASFASADASSLRRLVADKVAALALRRAEHFLGVQDVHSALDRLEKTAPALVKEAGHKIPLPLLTDVLRRLLHEQVSVRNLHGILETLVNPNTDGDAAQLAEKCRASLARQLSYQHASGGELYAYLVDPVIEDALRTNHAGLDPKHAHNILEGVRLLNPNGRAVLLASPDIRRVLRRLVEGSFPEIAVLTWAELDSELKVCPIGRLSVRWELPG